MGREERQLYQKYRNLKANRETGNGGIYIELYAFMIL